MKQNVDHNMLLRHMPQEFKLILEHIQELHYFTKPDYAKLHAYLDQTISRKQIKITDQFDWEINVPLEHSGSNKTNEVDVQALNNNYIKKVIEEDFLFVIILLVIINFYT